MGSTYGAQIKGSGRQLMLANHTLGEYADKATPKQAEFLLGLFGCELAYRDENKRRRLRRKAAFPTVKGFGDYDWSEVSLPESITKESVMGCSFI